ncbi:meteorin-like protein [Nilaparvata lugens]|uniref:meteorin-like protein n=1 Tax=Nilaparvata lugens TaxID=108931 RepID=UPI00193D0C70|nr:meteorin-like protein [Nilaparvata lugens]
MVFTTLNFGGRGSSPGAFQIIVSVIVLLILTPVMSFVLGEECDWSGSGLGHNAERGVTPVYLRCGMGRVSWVYPGGALRVLLRLGSSGRQFRGCIKASPDFAGARLFLEGPRGLVPLLDPHPSPRVQCFYSRHGQVALYMEALHKSPATFPRQVAQFDYDLEAQPRSPSPSYYDHTQECRPCTNEEMTHAFCSSDLVTRGIIRGVENLDDLKVSEITVKVTKHLRESTPDELSSLAEDLASNEIDRTQSTTDGDKHKDRTQSTSDTDKHNVTVRLQVPQHCGARHGAGEFVFMARRKLGDLVLRCAPRLEDWIDVVRSENAKGSAHCLLYS